jgi:hypothetical protein
MIIVMVSVTPATSRNEGKTMMKEEVKGRRRIDRKGSDRRGIKLWCKSD